MSSIFDATNDIDATAQINANVKLGKYNKIGKNVIIDTFRGVANPSIEIGDNNIINDNTRILVGEGGFVMKDWNLLHNDMLVMAEDTMLIGHNCWFGQNTILDASGGLEIGNGVRVGMYSQIWTHVASGELIEGCTLFAKRKTVIQDEVWLVGSCVVSSGITLGRRSTCLINSVITKDTEEGRSYAGAPAKLMEKANFYKPVTLAEKFDMIYNWASDFTKGTEIKLERRVNKIIMQNPTTMEQVIITDNYEVLDDEKITQFNLANKTYKKNNSALERSFYKYIYNHKARFIPV